MRPEGPSTLGEILIAKNILPETARILQCRYLRSRFGYIAEGRARTLKPSHALTVCYYDIKCA
jgi:hypothetical protein